jgi:hypothetical protein
MLRLFYFKSTESIGEESSYGAPIAAQAALLERSHSGQKRLLAPLKRSYPPRVPARSPDVHGNPFLRGLATSPPRLEPRLAIYWNAVNLLFELLKLHLCKLVEVDKPKPRKALLKEWGVAWRSYSEPFFDSCGIMPGRSDLDHGNAGRAGADQHQRKDESRIGSG